MLDREDGEIVDAVQVAPLVTNTLMHDSESRVRLAREVLDFGVSLKAGDAQKIEPA